MKYHVIAGNVFEFDRFIKKKSAEMWNEGNTSISLSDFVYVSSVDTLKGLSEIQGFYVGTWKNRSDVMEIQLQVHIIKEKMKQNEILSKIQDAIVQFPPVEISEEPSTTIGSEVSWKPEWTLSASSGNTLTLHPYVTESRVREIIQEELAKLQTQP